MSTPINGKTPLNMPISRQLIIFTTILKPCIEQTTAKYKEFHNSFLNDAQKLNNTSKVLRHIGVMRLKLQALQLKNAQFVGSLESLFSLIDAIDITYTNFSCKTDEEVKEKLKLEYDVITEAVSNALYLQCQEDLLSRMETRIEKDQIFIKEGLLERFMFDAIAYI